MTDFATCLAELDAVTRELAGTPPDEFARFQRLLARRQAAIQLLATDVDGDSSPAGPEHLQQIHDTGQTIAERIRIVQAGLREQLREMHRVGVTLRALGAPAEDHSIDYRA